MLCNIYVYADFSGGIDIARGFSQILGIELDQNFTQPFFSVSIEEFWRKWHITLGSWMRDYIFYPLSLSKTFAGLSRISRKLLGQKIGKKVPAILSMFIVFLLVGFWHEPQWNFIAYGIYNGIFIVCGIIFSEYYEKIREFLRFDPNTVSWRLFRYARTFLIVGIGKFLSHGKGFNHFIPMLRHTFTGWQDLSFITNGSLTILGIEVPDWFVLIFAIAVLFLVDHWHEKGIRIRETISRQHIVFRWLIYYAVILLILIFGVYGPGYNAASFIYEKF